MSRSRIRPLVLTCRPPPCARGQMPIETLSERGVGSQRSEQNIAREFVRKNCVPPGTWEPGRRLKSSRAGGRTMRSRCSETWKSLRNPEFLLSPNWPERCGGVGLFLNDGIVSGQSWTSSVRTSAADCDAGAQPSRGMEIASSSEHQHRIPTEPSCAARP